MSEPSVGLVPVWLENVWRWLGDDRPAVYEPGRTTSWIELAELVGRSQTLLDAIGAQPGMPVPALVEASAEVFALTLAASASARPLAPMGTRLTVDELVSEVRGLGAGGVIVADGPLASTARQVASQTGCSVVLLELDRYEVSPVHPTVGPSDPAFILHTSGTTGAPKRVVWTQEKMARRSAVWAGMSSLGPGGSLVCASPFHHLAGVANFAVAMDVGAANVPLKRFTVEAFREACRHAPTHALLVPTMIEMLLEEGDLQVPSIRYLQYGASPIRPATMRRLAELMPEVAIANIFGQTEGAPLTCLTPADHRRAVGGEDQLLLSVGRAVPGVDLRIAEPDDEGIGEVWARASHLAVTDGDGWLHTGDLGRMDPAGYLYLVARKHDMIVRGGENIYPAEVERVLDAQPGVKESAVVGAPDDRLGERVVAFIVPEGRDAPPDPADLRRAASAALSSFKVPSEFRIAEELPRNAAGKVLRRELAAGAEFDPA